MNAAILAIGDELALGQRLDTNSAWLAQQLVARAVHVVEHRTVEDDRAAIAAAVRDLAARCDLLLITGGLGPTDDDLTREALGDVLDPGAALRRDARAAERLRRRFEASGRDLPVSNLKQADRPPSMTFVANPLGTAPGLTGAHEACRIFALPGPPREMSRMFDDAVTAALPPGDEERWIATATVCAYGLGESHAAERLGALMARDRATLVGTTASEGILTARIRGRGPRPPTEAAVAEMRSLVEREWAPYAFGAEPDTLGGAVGALLAARGQSVATAESCTGGLLGAMIVDVPGASAFYKGGWVTYDNALKVTQLAVPEDALRRHGAVSAPVARAMAEAARERAAAAWSLSVTGIAGPEGGGPGKPAGTVFIGVAGPHGTTVAHLAVRGDRATVRDRSAKSALQLLRFRLLGLEEPPLLLWERRETIPESSS